MTVILEFAHQETGHAALHGFIADNVEQGSSVYTDEFRAYNGLSASYTHDTVKDSVVQYVDGQVYTYITTIFNIQLGSMNHEKPY